jgi:two-component system sensor histidine kinase RegB
MQAQSNPRLPMPRKLSLTLAAPAQHLQQLVVIRSLVFACLCLSALLGAWLIPTQLPYVAITLILLGFAGINLLTYLRLRQTLPVTELEFFIQLLVDVGVLSLLFYFSGGANNPFISYFLVPICISAATLNWSYTWLLTGLCLVSYSLLLFFHIPLPAISPGQDSAHAHHQTLNLHVLGMWLNFFISAMLITYFVVRMAHDLRRHDELLTRQREDDLRDEQLMAVATLAAGTAHELGTPLSTMKVLLGELCDEYSQPQLHKDLQLLSDQVDQCTQTLQHLVATAEQTRDGEIPLQPLHKYCRQIIERWLLMRPEVQASIAISTEAPEISAPLHPTIAQSLINLLNNAADANPANIQVEVDWDSEEMRWKIADEGPGIPLEIADQLGKTFVTTKGSGLGLGLFLTQATINRYGGQVRLYNRSPQGTLTELTLPLTGAIS